MSTRGVKIEDKLIDDFIFNEEKLATAQKVRQAIIDNYSNNGSSVENTLSSFNETEQEIFKSFLLACDELEKDADTFVTRATIGDDTMGGGPSPRKLLEKFYPTKVKFYDDHIQYKQMFKPKRRRRCEIL